MRLWTIQSPAAYEIIKSGTVYRCDPAKSTQLSLLGYTTSYSWLAGRMREKLGIVEGVDYPIWAWHTWQGNRKPPDMRRTLFRKEQRPRVILEVDVPDRRVLLSDHDLWCVVLKDCYILPPGCETPDQLYDWYESLHPVPRRNAKIASWEFMFDIRNSYSIQATFWELHEEDIVSARFIN